MNIQWRAFYRDGTELFQYDPVTLKENRYEDIDRFNTLRFDLIDRKTEKVLCSVYLNDGQRLIFRRRNFIKMDGTRVVTYMAGWQQTIYTNAGPKNITSIMYLHEDGSVSMDGSRNNLELLPLEQ